VLLTIRQKFDSNQALLLLSSARLEEELRTKVSPDSGFYLLMGTRTRTHHFIFITGSNVNVQREGMTLTLYKNSGIVETQQMLANDGISPHPCNQMVTDHSHLSRTLLAISFPSGVRDF
jgi:hypothetical protein